MYFQKPFSFEGRISRGEFFLSWIIFYVSVILFHISGIYLIELMFENPNDFQAFVAVIYIPAFWFKWAQGAKRCHDRGNSGWFQLIPFYIFVLLFAKGDIGETGWGPDPLIEVEEKRDEEIY